MDRPDIYIFGSWKAIITFLVFAIIIGYFVFGPFGKLLDKSLGEKLIEAKFFVRASEIEMYIRKIPSSSVQIFVYFHVVDSFFALFYALFLWSLVVRIFSKNLELANSFLTLIPLFGGICDLLENITLILAKFFESKIPSVFFLPISSFITLKFLFLFASLVLIVIGIIISTVKKATG